MGKPGGTTDLITVSTFLESLTSLFAQCTRTQVRVHTNTYTRTHIQAHACAPTHVRAPTQTNTEYGTICTRKSHGTSTPGLGNIFKKLAKGCHKVPRRKRYVSGTCKVLNS